MHLLALVLLLAGPAAQSPTGDSAKAPAANPVMSPEVATALERFQVDDLTGAREILDQFLKNNPEDLLARLLAVEDMRLEENPDLDLMEKEFRRLQNLSPGSPDPLRHLAETFLKAGEFDRAEETIHDALDLFPQRSELIHTLGNIQVARGELDAGLRLLEKAAAASPDNLIIQRDLGLALAQKGHNGRALAHTRSRRRSAWQNP